MSREKGDMLEDRISHDLNINKTTNSGAKWDNGDLSNKRYIIECKVKNKEGFQPCKGEINKLISQADKHSKDWFYIQQTLDKTFVVMDYDVFITLWTNNGNNNAS
jgi:hypothetical protein